MVHQAHSKPMCMHVTMHVASYDVCILKFRTGSSSQREIKSIQQERRNCQAKSVLHWRNLCRNLFVFARSSLNKELIDMYVCMYKYTCGIIMLALKTIFLRTDETNTTQLEELSMSRSPHRKCQHMQEMCYYLKSFYFIAIFSFSHGVSYRWGSNMTDCPFIGTYSGTSIVMVKHPHTLAYSFSGCYNPLKIKFHLCPVRRKYYISPKLGVFEVSSQPFFFII